MNAGFSNLDTLKKFLLAASMVSGTDYDDAILAIGRGMAGLFDKACNRKFVYMQDDTIIFSGDRPHYFLPRFPLVHVSKVEMRYFIADNWTDISGQPLAWNPESGMLHFGYTLGRNPLQVRATYTGGFQFEQLEPADVGYPTTLPQIPNTPDPGTGQQAIEDYKYLLPDDLRTAWLMQCQEVWNKRDDLGLGIINKSEDRHKILLLDLLPIVRQMIQPFVRYQLS